MSDVSVLYCRGILLQSHQRFNEAMHRYRVAIQCRPRLAGKCRFYKTDDLRYIQLTADAVPPFVHRTLWLYTEDASKSQRWNSFKLVHKAIKNANHKISTY
jgi:hypothetical protein